MSLYSRVLADSVSLCYSQALFHLFNLYFFIQQKSIWYSMQVSFSHAKTSAFCITMQTSTYKTNTFRLKFIHPPKICVFEYNIYYSFAGRILLFSMGMVIAFNIPLLLQWIHISLTKMFAHEAFHISFQLFGRWVYANSTLIWSTNAIGVAIILSHLWHRFFLSFFEQCKAHFEYSLAVLTFHSYLYSFLSASLCLHKHSYAYNAHNHI